MVNAQSFVLRVSTAHKANTRRAATARLCLMRTAAGHAALSTLEPNAPSMLRGDRDVLSSYDALAALPGPGAGYRSGRAWGIFLEGRPRSSIPVQTC